MCSWKSTHMQFFSCFVWMCVCALDRVSRNLPSDRDYRVCVFLDVQTFAPMHANVPKRVQYTCSVCVCLCVLVLAMISGMHLVRPAAGVLLPAPVSAQNKSKSLFCFWFCLPCSSFDCCQSFHCLPRCGSTHSSPLCHYLLPAVFRV